MSDDDDPDKMLRFTAVRLAMDEALRAACPDGYRVMMVIAEPTGACCVISDWHELEGQLMVLRLLTERCIDEMEESAPPPIH